MHMASLFCCDKCSLLISLGKVHAMGQELWPQAHMHSRAAIERGCCCAADYLIRKLDGV